jgi:3-oxoacyl-[acyl-carrier protein] reductase
MDSLQGKIAIVTGASGGIGRQLSLQLAAEGVSVLASARQQGDALTHLVEEIRNRGGKAAGRSLDVSDPEQCAELVRWTVQEMGSLHMLVNCAGLGHWASAERTTDLQWRQTMGVNLDGVFYMCRAAIVPMKKAGAGHIVNVASVLGRRGAPNFSGYCASKAAVVAFSESLSREVRGDGIQVSVVAPGTTATGFRDHHAGRPQEPSLTDPALMLRPEDVASAIVWTLKASRHVASVQIILEPFG